jgi:hypothetical protein
MITFTLIETRAIAQTVGGTGSSRTSSSTGMSSSGTSVGGGFTGGGTSPGGGFTGGGTSSSGGFTGGGTSSGTGFTGSAGGGGGRFGGGSSTQVPTAANPFLSTYNNPLVIGMVDVTGKQTVNKAFGQPMYATYSTSSSTGGTTFGSGFGTLGGAGGTTLGTNVIYGYNSFGMGRTVNYSAERGETVPVVVHPNPQLKATVTDLIQRSTAINPVEPITVNVSGNTVFLEGIVSSAREKRIVEGMIRMTPGVRDVVNNLVIETFPLPKK